MFVRWSHEKRTTRLPRLSSECETMRSMKKRRSRGNEVNEVRVNENTRGYVAYDCCALFGLHARLISPNAGEASISTTRHDLLTWSCLGLSVVSIWMNTVVLQQYRFVFWRMLKPKKQSSTKSCEKPHPERSACLTAASTLFTDWRKTTGLCSPIHDHACRLYGLDDIVPSRLHHSDNQIAVRLRRSTGEDGPTASWERKPHFHVMAVSMSRLL